MRFEEMRDWFQKRERMLTGMALLVGFIIDSLTLQRIDLGLENAILLSHLAITGLSIAFLNIYDAGKLNIRFLMYVRPWVPLIMQFSFGALFSGFLIFYTRSASLASSWIFLLFLLFFLIGNETFRARYERLVFQTSIFFVALSSYLIFSVPIVVNRIGPIIFILSVILSLLIIVIFLSALKKVIPLYIQESQKSIMRIVSGISMLLVVMYFFNIIPPIPLSLKTADVYHFIARNGGVYEVRGEHEPWYESFLPYERVSITPGESLYLFSAVFAPADINTRIVHEWQHKVKDTEWVSVSRVAFPILGGSDGGYRGYSIKNNVTPGWWRVNVETERGQLLGRVTFNVREVESPPQLESNVE